jgi:hypothetical protein
MKKTDKIWAFITEQFERCRKRHEEKDYRECIDLVFDVAGNMANLYLLMEKSPISTDKGRLLNTLSLMHKTGIFSADYGKTLREKWQLRNIAKYGFFASAKADIKEITIPEEEVKSLFSLAKRMMAEFKEFAGGRNEQDRL